VTGKTSLEGCLHGLGGGTWSSRGFAKVIGLLPKEQVEKARSERAIQVIRRGELVSFAFSNSPPQGVPGRPAGQMVSGAEPSGLTGPRGRMFVVQSVFLFWTWLGALPARQGT